MQKRSFMGRILRIFGIVLALLLVLACFVPYVPVHGLPYLSFLGLVVPVLVVANLTSLLVFALLRYWKTALFAAFSLILSLLVLGSFVRPSPSSPEQKADLDILSYNVRQFWGGSNSPDSSDEVERFITDEDPEIVCIQEYTRKGDKEFKSYPYRYRTPLDEDKSTQVILSKFPIVGSGSLDLPQTANNIIYADIVVHNDTIRIYNIHYQSYKIHSFRRGLERNAKGFLGRMAGNFVRQEAQAQLFDAHRKACPYPIIVCGDFNNTQFSRTYHITRGDLKDSFLEKGSGLGTTFGLIRGRIPLRIDFILVDLGFEVTGHRNFTEAYSDHYPVLASIKLPSP